MKYIVVLNGVIVGSFKSYSRAEERFKALFSVIEKDFKGFKLYIKEISEYENHIVKYTEDINHYGD